MNNFLLRHSYGSELWIYKSPILSFPSSFLMQPNQKWTCLIQQGGRSGSFRGEAYLSLLVCKTLASQWISLDMQQLCSRRQRGDKGDKGELRGLQKWIGSGARNCCWIDSSHHFPTPFPLPAKFPPPRYCLTQSVGHGQKQWWTYAQHWWADSQNGGQQNAMCSISTKRFFGSRKWL